MKILISASKEKRRAALSKLIKDLEEKRDCGWYGEVNISFKEGKVMRAGFTENKKYI